MSEPMPLPRREPAVPYAALALALLFASASSRADDTDVHGRFELQDAQVFARSDSIDAQLGEQHRNDLVGNARFIWEPSGDRWSFLLHYLVNVEDGGGVRVMRAEAALLPAPPPTWLDMNETFTDRPSLTGTQSIDRLALTYTTPDFVIRVGRQALTWGSGIVFHPMDLFDPFSPSATDTEYKPGTDMVYAQWLYSDGSDLQFILVPRSAVQGERPTSDESSAALHLQVPLFDHETTWLIARDHGDWVGAVGINGALGGATWNLEWVPTFVAHGATHVSYLANLSDATTLFERNATVFLEYFHNG